MTSLDPIQVFRTEAAELFEAIEGGLLDLLHDLSNQDQIDAVFRSLHTLKGSGAMFGFEALAAFTHHCETAFDRVRKGEVPATAELVAAVLDAQDHMKALVQSPRGDHEAAGEILLAKLHAAVGGGAAHATAVPAATASPAPASSASGQTIWHMTFFLPHNAMANGTNPLGLLDELRELGECEIVADRSRIPDLADLDARELHIGWTVRLTTGASRSDIEDVFIFVMDDMELELKEISAAPSPEPEAPQEMHSSAPVEQAAVRPTETAAVPPPASSGPAAAAETRQSRTAENVRVPAERLDELMDRVGELVIAQSRLSQLANTSVLISTEK